ncbi:MAG: hypothetical protein WA940_12530, partial [Sphingopyxis sp.]
MTGFSRLLPALLMATAPLAVLPVVAAEEAAPAPAVDANAVAETYAALLERDYVYPDTGRRYAAAIRA